MSILDFDALEQAQVQRDPCDYVVVPRFVKADKLPAVNMDYPDIREPGNFPPDQLACGGVFEKLLEELHSPALKEIVADKFDIDLKENPLQMTVRKYSEASDGNVHNDSKGKLVTALIYFNEEWHHEGGKLRFCRSSWNIEDYAAEVTPTDGTLVIFKRSDASFHGFKPVVAERRSIQMYWVKPKRAARSDDKQIGVKKAVKRLLKLRPRWLRCSSPS